MDWLNKYIKFTVLFIMGIFCSTLAIAADLPPMDVSTNSIKLNLTVLGAIGIFCVTAATAVIKLWGKSDKKDVEDAKLVRDADIQQAKIARDEEIKKIKEAASEMSRDIAILKNEATHTNKSIDEMKQTNREIATRLDDLLKQIMEWLS